MDATLVSLSAFKNDTRSLDYLKWLNADERIQNTQKGLLQAYGKFLSFNFPFFLLVDTLEVKCGKKMRFNTVMAASTDGSYCRIIHMELVPPETTLGNFEVYSCVRKVMYYLHTHNILSLCVAVISDGCAVNNSLKELELPRLYDITHLKDRFSRTYNLTEEILTNVYFKETFFPHTYKGQLLQFGILTQQKPFPSSVKNKIMTELSMIMEMCRRRFVHDKSAFRLGLANNDQLESVGDRLQVLGPKLAKEVETYIPSSVIVEDPDYGAKICLLLALLIRIPEPELPLPPPNSTYDEDMESLPKTAED